VRSALYLAALLSTAAAAADLPPGVKVEENAAGRTFTTSDGRGLYWSNADVAAKALTCVEACLESRPPLVAPAGATPPTDWSIMTHPNGTLVWAYRDRPLYTAVKDSFAGARLAAGGAWHLMFEPAALPAGLSLSTSLLGRVLADHKGRTLYTRTGDAPVSGPWQPLTAPALATVAGDWSLVPLPDGTRQWAYKGKPLYRYDNDRDPQDVRGHGVDGVWSAVILQPAPALPPWVTITRVDLGWVFADRDRMTLYVPADFEQIKIAQTCPKECMDKYWRPVLAESSDVPIGRWAPIENEAGQRQWSYSGMPVFTHTRDTKPGEMAGNSFAVGYSIGDGFRVILIDDSSRF